MLYHIAVLMYIYCGIIFCLLDLAYFVYHSLVDRLLSYSQQKFFMKNATISIDVQFFCGQIYFYWSWVNALRMELLDPMVNLCLNFSAKLFFKLGPDF